MNILDFNMNVQDAIAAPRISFAEPDLLLIEEGIPESVREELEALGHKIRIVRGLGNAHGLAIIYDKKGDPVHFEGGSDPRGRGKAEGY